MFTPGRRMRGGDVRCCPIDIELDIGCRFDLVVARETHAVVIVEPHASGSGRVVSTSFAVEPHRATSVYLDHFGNTCRRVDLPVGQVSLSYAAVVASHDEPDPVVEGAAELAPSELPDDALLFLLPSRYCESDLIASEAIQRFGSLPPGWSRVQAVSDWVHGELTFSYGSSSPALSASGVLASRTGVCRDFTHLGIALCRALNIPARYVFGYLPDIGVPDPGTPMDFCAWMEVFLGGAWHTFDPRNNERRIGRTVIARGRDAADVAMITSFGQVQLREMTVVAQRHT